MSKIIKYTKIEGLKVNCQTLGDLLTNFDVKLNYFMNDKKRSFPLTEKDNVFHKYVIIDYYDNSLHTFFGYMDDIPIEYILDIRHQRINYVIHESNLFIKEYNLEGELLNEIQSDDNDCSIEDIIEKYFKRDYLCYSIGELIESFNLDIELSDELKEHIIVEKEGQSCEYCCGHKILFCEYYLKDINQKEFYVFHSMFDNDTIILDSEAPTYYIDSKNKNIYIETSGMVGTCILQFDEKNQIINDAHSWIVDLEMFLKLTDNNK